MLGRPYHLFMRHLYSLSSGPALETRAAMYAARAKTGEYLHKFQNLLSRSLRGFINNIELCAELIRRYFSLMRLLLDWVRHANDWIRKPADSNGKKYIYTALYIRGQIKMAHTVIPLNRLTGLIERYWQNYFAVWKWIKAKCI